MTTKKVNEAAVLLARRSVKARREAWGEKEFIEKMREWGKLGGRRPGSRNRKGGSK